MGAVLLAMLSETPRADACGPDFPVEYLSRRDDVLSGMPDGLFMLEATRLVPPPAHRLKVVEGEDPEHPNPWRDGGGEAERGLYQRGARAFLAHQDDAARSRFAALLALPEANRKHFTVAAQFMLARLGDSTRWAQARALAAQGFDDDAGLAVASFGEEARDLLRHDDAGAVRLYAQQASHGSPGGAVSLLFVARQLAADEPRLRRALADPLCQRLMSTLLWTRSGDGWWADDASHPDAAKVLQVLAAMPQVAGADRLAAALFRAGRYEDAARFAPLEASPLAHWVRAKLALRAGKLELADQELAQAAPGYPLNELWSDEYTPAQRPRRQLEMERSSLALTKGQYDAAMDRAAASCSWLDLAYLADRVLDVEALQRWVDGPAAGALALCDLGEKPSTEPDNVYWVPGNHVQGMRSLLARRLLRGGRGREALPYFDPGLRAIAERYLAALEAGRDPKLPPLQRAPKLLEAAKLMRAEGMTLAGTEAAPDYKWTEGEYDPHAWDEPDAGAGPSVYWPADERARLARSAPNPDRRFHYRFTASALAEEAAGLVSPRSQAYVALLCESARYVMYRDPARARRSGSRPCTAARCSPSPWTLATCAPSRSGSSRRR